MHTTSRSGLGVLGRARTSVRRIRSVVAAVAATTLATAVLVAGPGGGAAQAAIATPASSLDGSIPIVMPGTYTIQTILSPTGSAAQVLNVGAIMDGTPVQIWQNNGSTAQKFTIERRSDGYYTIKNVASGRYVEVTGSGTANNTGLRIWPYSGSCGQKWAITLSAGSYVIQSACSGRAVDLTNYVTTNGNRVQIYDNSANSAQRWRLIPDFSVVQGGVLSSRVFTIRTALDNNRALGLASGSTAAGTAIQIRNSDGSQLQDEIEVKRTDDGFYTMYMAQGNVMGNIDVSNAGTASGTKVQIWPPNGTCAQKWAVTLEAGAYYFFSACSGKPLGSAGPGVADGTAVQIINNNGASGQQWKLIPYNPTGYTGVWTLQMQSGTVLDAASTANGADVLIDAKGTAHPGSAAGALQSFTVEQTSDGFATLKNNASGRYVTVSPASVSYTADNTSVKLADWNGSCAQKWLNHYGGDSMSAIFYSACSGKVLTSYYGYGAVASDPGSASTLREWRLVNP